MIPSQLRISDNSHENLGKRNNFPDLKNNGSVASGSLKFDQTYATNEQKTDPMAKISNRSEYTTTSKSKETKKRIQHVYGSGKKTDQGNSDKILISEMQSVNSPTVKKRIEFNLVAQGSMDGD